LRCWRRQDPSAKIFSIPALTVLNARIDRLANDLAYMTTMLMWPTKGVEDETSNLDLGVLFSGAQVGEKIETRALSFLPAYSVRPVVFGRN